MADWFTGLLGGFQDRKNEIADQRYREAQAAAQREAGIYQLLLDSPDPHTQALAATGLIQSSQPGRPKGGLAGYFGELEQNPIFPLLLQHIQTPETVTRQRQIPGVESPDTIQPGVPIQPTVLTPPGAQPAAQAPTARTSPGAPPPPPATYQTGPQPEPTGSVVDIQGGPQPPQTVTETTTRPRQVFPTIESRMQSQMQGRIQGFLDTYRQYTGEEPPPAFVKELIERLAGGGGFGSGRAGGRPLGWREGEITQDPETGEWGQDLYNPSDPSQRMRIPATNPLLAGRSGAFSEDALAAAELFGQPGELPRETLARISSGPTAAQDLEAVRKLLDQKARNRSFNTAMGTQEAVPYKEFSPQELLTSQLDLQTRWNKASETGTVVQDAVSRMESAYADYSAGRFPGGAEAFVMTWAKLLDPMSVVREAEFLRPGLAQSLWGRMDALRQKWLRGGGAIPPGEMQEYLQVARNLNEAVQRGVGSFRRQISSAVEFNPKITGGRPTADYLQGIFGGSTVGLPPRYDQNNRLLTQEPGATTPGPTAPPAPADQVFAVGEEVDDLETGGRAIVTAVDATGRIVATRPK